MSGRSLQKDRGAIPREPSDGGGKAAILGPFGRHPELYPDDTQNGREVIRNVLKRLAAMRAFKREENSSVSLDHAAEAVGMTPQQVDDMYRLLATADYDDRYVIP